MNVDTWLAWGAQHPWLWPLLIIVASFILEDPTTVAVGVLIGKGQLPFSVGFLSLATVIFLGDLGLYGLGYAIKRGFVKGQQDYLRPVPLTVAVARFVPGMRTLTFTAAGFTRFPLRNFLLIIFPSSVVWTLLLLLFARELHHWLPALPTWLWVLIGVSVFAGLQVLTRKKSVGVVTFPPPAPNEKKKER